jgi:hypothetical protein
MKRFLEKTRKVTLESRNAVTFNGLPPAQIVTRWEFTPKEHIERFDFTITQACIYWTGAMWVGYCDCWFEMDARNKKLVYTRPNREEEPLGSLHRAFKFVGKGYKLSGEQFAKLAERMTYRVLEAADEFDLSLFSEDEKMQHIWRTWSWRAGRGSG